MTAATIDNITPIELLVELAHKGEVDPWNLDLVAVADRYITALGAREEASLPLTGRMILYACILLRLKAQELSRRYQEAMPPPPGAAGPPGLDPFDPTDDGVLAGDLDPALGISPEEGLILLARPPRRRRPVTMAELVLALRSFEESVKRSKVDGVPAEALVTAAAHLDDILADVGRVRQILARFTRGRRVDFRDLVGSGMRAANLFLALLHMAAADEVGLAQEGFYGRLWVVRRARAA